MRRYDIPALTLGLVFCLIAALGLWAGFGTVDWRAVQLAAPLSLVTIGLLGLLLSRKKSKNVPERGNTP